MKFELKNLPRNSSDEEIISEIRRVDTLLNKDILSRRDFDKVAKITSGAILKNRFDDWQTALNLAGLGHKYFGPKVTERMRNQETKDLTDSKILEELRAVAKKLNRDYVTREELKYHSDIMSHSIVESRFGTWINGLKMAGLNTSPAFMKKFSDSEYFENLLNVWTHHGRQPFTREMDDTPSVITSKAYQGHFGSWRKALEAFVEKMNQEQGDVISDEPALVLGQPKEIIREEIKKHSVLVENKRDITLGLRYRVLHRDHFKCVRCGSSPATDPLCRLHIDHMLPFSKGGKTLFENLQTLCESCNLGKGNRFTD